MRAQYVVPMDSVGSMKPTTAPRSPADGDASSGSGLDQVRSAGMAVGGSVAVLWIVEAIDTVLSHRLDAYGIRPHRVSGLRGIAFAPFLHAGWGHLIGNTLPFVVLAMIVALKSLRRFASVVVIVAVISGLGAWLFGSTNSVHLGASGVIFGLLTYLLVRGWFARKLGQILIGVVVAAFYGTMLFGVLPINAGVSWQAHLFGAIGGVVAAYLLDRKPPAKVTALPA